MAENRTQEQMDYEEPVEYTAPVDYSGRERADIFVAVNGETVRIRRGERVMLKRKFLLALQDAALQDREARELQRKLAKG